MKFIFLFPLILISCAGKETIQRSEPINVDTAINLARTGYVRSCIQAHKVHRPDKSWRTHCLQEANIYINEIFDFLKEP